VRVAVLAAEFGPLSILHHFFAAGVALGEACTIVLRGASSHILEEADRSLHDALCVLSETVSEKWVVGRLSAYVREHCSNSHFLEQASLHDALCALSKTANGHTRLNDTLAMSLGVASQLACKS
jgi:hypothetical protein